MGIHSSRVHWTDIESTLKRVDTKKPPKCLTAGVLEFLGLERWDYIHTHITPILTYLRSSLQTSLRSGVKLGNEEVNKKTNTWFNSKYL